MVQTDPAPGLPSRIIISASEQLAKFQAVIDKFDQLGIEMRTALGELIECLQDEQDAAYELTYTSYEMLPDTVNTGAAEPEQDHVPEFKSSVNMPIIDQEAVEYINAREKLGFDLLKLFVEYKLYRHGKLFYQIHDLLGDALVLDKIGVPILQEERELQRNVNAITRQVDLAHRRRHQEDVSRSEAQRSVVCSPSREAKLRALADILGGSPRVDGLGKLPAR